MADGPHRGAELVKITGTDPRPTTELGKLLAQLYGREIEPGELVDVAADLLGKTFVCVRRARHERRLRHPVGPPRRPGVSRRPTDRRGPRKALYPTTFESLHHGEDESPGLRLDGRTVPVGAPTRAYQEDIYAYNPAAGLYERTERAWLGHAVTWFVAAALGSDAVGADYVADVARSARDLAFLPGDRQPPFWIDRRGPADVVVAANGVVDSARSWPGACRDCCRTPRDLLAVAGVPYAYDPSAACPAWIDTLRWMVATATRTGRCGSSSSSAAGRSSAAGSNWRPRCGSRGRAGTANRRRCG